MPKIENTVISESKMGKKSKTTSSTKSTKANKKNKHEVDQEYDNEIENKHAVDQENNNEVENQHKYEIEPVTFNEFEKIIQEKNLVGNQTKTKKTATKKQEKNDEVLYTLNDCDFSDIINHVKNYPHLPKAFLQYIEEFEKVNNTKTITNKYKNTLQNIVYELKINIAILARFKQENDTGITSDINKIMSIIQNICYQNRSTLNKIGYTLITKNTDFSFEQDEKDINGVYVFNLFKNDFTPLYIQQCYSKIKELESVLYASWILMLVNYLLLSNVDITDFGSDEDNKKKLATYTKLKEKITALYSDGNPFIKKIITVVKRVTKPSTVKTENRQQKIHQNIGDNETKNLTLDEEDIVGNSDIENYNSDIDIDSDDDTSTYPLVSKVKEDMKN